MDIISTNHINKSFLQHKAQACPVLNDINVNIEVGKITSLMGASGVGKSTLLYILGTLEKPDSGNVMLKLGERVVDYSQCNDKQISQIRNKYIGFVFQFHHLLPEFTVIENIMLPAMILGEKTNKEIEKQTLLLMDQFAIKKIRDQKPTELSGGEQQRTAIARALINSPTIVMADEPTGNLDSENSQNVITLIKQINCELGTTFLIATHSDEVAHKSDRIIQMKDGKIV